MRQNLLWSLILFIGSNFISAADSYQYPLVSPGQGLLIEVQIDNHAKPVKFLVDTGSTFTIFDKKISNILGPRKTPGELEEILGENFRGGVLSEPGALNELELYGSVSMKAGDLELDNGYPIAISDFSDMRSFSDIEIMGILGMSNLHKYALEVDFNAKILFLHKKLPQRYHSGFDTVAPLFWNNQNLPFMRMELNNNPLMMQLSTGVFYDHAQLTPDIINYLEMSQGLNSKRSFRVSSIDGDGIMEELKSSQFSHDNTSYPEFYISRGQENILGLSFIAAHRVVMDFPRQMAMFNFQPNLFQPREGNISGVFLARKQGKVIAYAVEEGSPAFKAGIIPGDVVLKINDEVAEQGEIWVFMDKLRECKQVKLSLVKGSMEPDAREVTLCAQE